MIECPNCHRTKPQNRAGKTGRDSVGFHCLFCQINHTPEPEPWAYPEEVRRKVLQMYADGMSMRRIVCHLSLHHRTVCLWVSSPSCSIARSYGAREEHFIGVVQVKGLDPGRFSPEFILILCPHGGGQ